MISLSNYSQQIEFEKTLGQENIETLNSLIENFDTKILKNKYPKLKTGNAYKEFLKDIQKLIDQKIPVIEDHKYPMESFEIPEKKPQQRRPSRNGNSSKKNTSGGNSSKRNNVGRSRR